MSEEQEEAKGFYLLVCWDLACLPACSMSGIALLWAVVVEDSRRGEGGVSNFVLQDSRAGWAGGPAFPSQLIPPPLV